MLHPDDILQFWFADASVSPAAARARNEGFAKLCEELPTVRYVQFIDGDCALAATGGHTIAMSNSISRLQANRCFIAFVISPLPEKIVQRRCPPSVAERVSHSRRHVESVRREALGLQITRAEARNQRRRGDGEADAVDRAGFWVWRAVDHAFNPSVYYRADTHYAWF